MGRKVAIVAKGGTSVLAPYGDKEWEIWGLPWVSYPRIDVLFEVHEECCLPEGYTDRWKEAFPHYLNLPILTTASRVGEFKYGEELPIEEMKAVCNFTYLENSICYQIGYAMLQDDIDEIALFGVHMRGYNEYDHERAFLMYVMGVAEGKGIKLTIAPGSPLFMSAWVQGRYGVDGEMRNMNMWGGPSRPSITTRKEKEAIHVCDHAAD